MVTRAGRRTALPLWLLLMVSSCAAGGSVHLAGFQTSRHWDEQIKELTYEPGVGVHVDAPSEPDFDRRKPTWLVLYALPNGNTIEWTIGRKRAEGLDWHYQIQHIGAQTRRLREVVKDYNVIIAYLEASTRSWPAWRQQNANSSARIAGIIADLRQQAGGPDVLLVLSGHSGGGSFIFGYLDGVERIPDEVRRITFLDSNYAFSTEAGHGRKLLDWLRRKPDHFLTVLAYDDREITLDGKKVVSPTGGTYRATQRMLAECEKQVDLTRTTDGHLARYRGLDGRIDIIVHQNPDNRILHTSLVGDMNGFIHAMTSGTIHEGKAAVFGGPVTYEKWIQAD